VGVVVQIVGLFGLVIGWEIPRRTAGVSRLEKSSHGPLGYEQVLIALQSCRSHPGECPRASRHTDGQK
jgi:hypothetical protein